MNIGATHFQAMIIAADLPETYEPGQYPQIVIVSDPDMTAAQRLAFAKALLHICEEGKIAETNIDLLMGDEEFEVIDDGQ